MWNTVLRFARIKENKGCSIILVDSVDDTVIRGINLSRLIGAETTNVFELFELRSYEELLACCEQSPAQIESFPVAAAVAPVDGRKKVICAGLNYRSHIRETGSKEPLILFSKICDPTAPRARLVNDGAELLDYEVELGAVFDRDISSIEDYQKACVGYFVANDITARSHQIRNSKRGTSEGFGEAKSYPGYLPVGPIVAVVRPDNRDEFERSLSIELTVNGAIRQRSTTDLMYYSLKRILIEVIQADRQGHYCTIHGERIPLLDEGVIPQGTLVISGTPGGTAFQMPGFMSKLRIVMNALFFARNGKNGGLMARIKHQLVEHEKANSLYLKCGDQVEARISGLGSSKVEIEAQESI